MRLLATTEGDRAADVRDRAILMVLIAYGLRSGEVAGLRLEDLNWERERLQVRRPKPGRTHHYPLSRGVGQAILRYLRELRPRRPDRALFFTLNAPIRPLSGKATSHVVRSRLDRHATMEPEFNLAITASGIFDPSVPMTPDHFNRLARTRMKRIVDRGQTTLVSGSMRLFSPGPGKVTWGQRSAWRSSKTASVSCMRAPPIWCRNSRSRAANWCSRPPSANCTSTTCSSSTTSPTCVKDQAETSVLFELISSRYENRSLLVTANQPFGEWGSIFPEQAMTLAAIDRLVHRATIFELNVESYRRRTAVETKRGRGRIASRATPANTKVKLPGGASSKNKQAQENNP